MSALRTVWKWVKAKALWLVLGLVSLAFLLHRVYMPFRDWISGRREAREDSALDRQFKADQARAQEKAEKEVAAIHRHHEAGLSSELNQHAQEAQQVQEQGPEATAAWLNEFDRKLKEKP